LIEQHPRLSIKNLKIEQNKIILGSFPVWSLTQNESTLRIGISSKDILNKTKGEFPFFYGSSTNRFWSWYKQFVDPDITLMDVKCIKNSLIKNKIGITDVILSCKRKNQSALDKDLSQRVYNHDFISYPKYGETLKILCTSKGVMNEMLLCKSFFKLHHKIKIDESKSKLFERKFIEKIGGDINMLQKSIFIELTVEGGGIIQCIAIPSPGSPFRKLVNFGYTANVPNSYLNKYLFEVFKWFN
jgi:hypothetical protein